MMRGLIPLIVFAGLLIAFGVGLTRDPSALPSEMLDQPLPEFSLPALDEADGIITQDIVQGEVTLLNIFGSWCVACVQEHPKLMEIAASGEVKIIGVDWRDERSAGQRWLRRYGNPYSAVIFDEGSLLAIDLGVTGAPESFVIDKQGRVRYKHVGIVTDKVWTKELRPLIKRLQAGS